ncbi:hypothetical protein BN2476_1610003 [Paraburkholderia piptadeniae]|uniref:Uncharacterized protein n=1 Tax=Paraburkholderia piptadeniae TaxID=1701573 RepID=A0A1N7SWX1_9BURK|nr:hypothetical protein BN2476_1610003 [Paraburkholderia piptadeniae]
MGRTTRSRRLRTHRLTDGEHRFKAFGSTVDAHGMKQGYCLGTPQKEQKCKYDNLKSQIFGASHR